MNRILILLLIVCSHLSTGCSTSNNTLLKSNFYEKYKALSDLEKSFKPRPIWSYREYRLHAPHIPPFPDHGDAKQGVTMSHRLLSANLGNEKADKMLEKAFQRYGINEAWLDITRGVLHSTDGCDISQNPYLTWKHAEDQQPRLERLE